jgi:hypothetical protein
MDRIERIHGINMSKTLKTFFPLFLVLLLVFASIPLGHSYAVYSPAVWGDYLPWNSSDVATYAYTGTSTVQIHAEQHSATTKLCILAGHLNRTNGNDGEIQMIGRNLTITISVENVAVSSSASWLRIAVVACVNLATPYHDPNQGTNWNVVYLEFDYYWSPGTTPHAGGDFHFFKVGQFLPGTGFHHLILNFSDEFIAQYGQATYNAGKLFYVTCSTIELANANATVATTPFSVVENPFSASSPPSPSPSPPVNSPPVQYPIPKDPSAQNVTTISTNSTEQSSTGNGFQIGESTVVFACFACVVLLLVAGNRKRKRGKER